MENSIKRLYGRTIEGKEITTIGDLDIVATLDGDDVYFDVVWHSTDVGITYYKGNRGQFLATYECACAFCRGYEYAKAQREEK